MLIRSPMPDEPRTVYLFRVDAFGPGIDTVVSVAPADLVVSAFGVSGDHGQDGVRQVFGGNVFYRSDKTGELHRSLGHA